MPREGGTAVEQDTQAEPEPMPSRLGKERKRGDMPLPNSKKEEAMLAMVLFGFLSPYRSQVHNLHRAAWVTNSGYRVRHGGEGMVADASSVYRWDSAFGHHSSRLCSEGSMGGL